MRTIILGIESSCDETGVALVFFDDTPHPPRLLAHALHSQIKEHQPYGGVVPELASRDHIRRIIPLTKAVLQQANISLNEIDVIAYTKGPGLAGALLVGAGFANALAMSLDKPVLPIHHLEGHLLSPFLTDDPPTFPFLCLLVSGGHTQLMQVTGIGRYQLLGESIDDAAGEAFDKSAKLMGMPYPGGAQLSKMAQGGDPTAYAIPRPLLKKNTLDFSFAGLKTAVRTQVKKLLKENNLPDSLDEEQGHFTQISLNIQRNLCASTEAAIVDVLVEKTMKALEQTGMPRVVVAGGVGANTQLREKLNNACAKKNIPVHYPDVEFCTDNGAMIAYAAALRLQSGVAISEKRYSFEVQARWDLDVVA